MFTDLPKRECSDCGSNEWETYQNRRGKGVRCLDCGHRVFEKTNKLGTPEDPFLYTKKYLTESQKF